MNGTHSPHGDETGFNPEKRRRWGSLSGSTNSNHESPQVTDAGCTLYIHKYDERRQSCKPGDNTTASTPRGCSRFFATVI